MTLDKGSTHIPAQKADALFEYVKEKGYTVKTVGETTEVLDGKERLFWAKPTKTGQLVECPTELEDLLEELLTRCPDSPLDSAG